MNADQREISPCDPRSSASIRGRFSLYYFLRALCVSAVNPSSRLALAAAAAQQEGGGGGEDREREGLGDRRELELGAVAEERGGEGLVDRAAADRRHGQDAAGAEVERDAGV